MINPNKTSCYPEIETDKQELCSTYNQLAFIAGRTQIQHIGIEKNLNFEKQIAELLLMCGIKNHVGLLGCLLNCLLNQKKMNKTIK